VRNSLRQRISAYLIADPFDRVVCRRRNASACNAVNDLTHRINRSGVSPACGGHSAHAPQAIHSRRGQPSARAHRRQASFTSRFFPRHTAPTRYGRLSRESAANLFTIVHNRRARRLCLVDFCQGRAIVSRCAEAFTARLVICEDCTSNVKCRCHASVARCRSRETETVKGPPVTDVGFTPLSALVSPKARVSLCLTPRRPPTARLR
jgi:hypothetical protein